MMKKRRKIEHCEEKGHELIIVDEHWLSNNSLMATTECQKCKVQFQGLLIREGGIKSD